MQSGQLFRRIIILLAIGLFLGTGVRAQDPSCTCTCLKPMFDFLITSRNLFIRQTDNTTLINVISAATKAGYKIDYRKCAFFAKNINKPFYAISTDSVSTSYKARIGDCNVVLGSVNGISYNFYKLQSKACGSDVKVAYSNTSPTGSTVAELRVDSCFTCTVVTSSSCVSAITDNPVNPYLQGIAGNWRPAKSYVYYASRKESDPAQETNIKSDGTYKDFDPFWIFQSNGTMTPHQNEARWVWNSASTLFNQKGFEIENKDPLGRYNAGLYGYSNTLPVAVIQNSRYRESAFEGFEDYGFNIGICDTTCSPGRNFDFSRFERWIDSTQKHTGKYSIRVIQDSPVSVSAIPVAADNDVFNVSVNKQADKCNPGTQVLTSMKANSNTVLPGFSPLTGKMVLISAWVKEGQVCTVPTYTNSQIGIVVKRSSGNPVSSIATPTGNIIEGWQRFEQVISLPADATELSITLQANGSTTVYFDDVRVHPYNANMKSFVYNPVNLRLMAELDENNYATFYEYDDDGTLIRLKKETERGIKTIKETRSALVKDKTE